MNGEGEVRVEADAEGAGETNGTAALPVTRILSRALQGRHVAYRCATTQLRYAVVFGVVATMSWCVAESMRPWASGQVACALTLAVLALVQWGTYCFDEAAAACVLEALGWNGLDMTRDPRSDRRAEDSLIIALDAAGETYRRTAWWQVRLKRATYLFLGMLTIIYFGQVACSLARLLA